MIHEMLLDRISSSGLFWAIIPEWLCYDKSNHKKSSDLNVLLELIIIVSQKVSLLAIWLNQQLMRREVKSLNLVEKLQPYSIFL